MVLAVVHLSTDQRKTVVLLLLCGSVRDLGTLGFDIVLAGI